MNVIPLKIIRYETGSGACPIDDFLTSLNPKDSAIIRIRLQRVASGNLGDHTRLEGAAGLYEIIIHYGPGYRIYFARIKRVLVLLLCGGKKATQAKDIKKAVAYWRDFEQFQKFRE